MTRGQGEGVAGAAEIFQQVAHQIITTGASGLSLPPRSRSLSDAELIQIFTKRPTK